MQPKGKERKNMSGKLKKISESVYDIQCPNNRNSKKRTEKTKDFIDSKYKNFQVNRSADSLAQWGKQ